MSDGERQWEQSPTSARRSIPFVNAAVGAVLALVIGFALGQLLTRDSTPRPQPNGSPPATIAAPSASADAPVPSGSPSTVTVPLVEGLTVAEARRVLNSVRLRPSLDEFEAKAQPGSRVVGQTPAEGSPAPKGSKVGLRTDAYEELPVATSCTALIAAREYGDVIVGAEVEVRTADAGQLLIMDTLEPVSDLRVRVRRQRGPGKLRFETPQGLSREVTLWADQHRMAAGWPPHWGVGANVTGPGCWQLRITGGDAVERLAFEISDSDWKRFWRQR